MGCLNQKRLGHVWQVCAQKVARRGGFVKLDHRATRLPRIYEWTGLFNWDSFLDSFIEGKQEMPDTDIYKTKEPVREGSSTPPHVRKRRRRSASRRSFDEHDRRRRSKNSGLRRLLHLSRKTQNEKRFWWGILSVTVVLLVGIAIWQFAYLEYVARKQSRQDERYELIQPAESAAE